MTDAERALWRVLRNRQLDGWKFRRQSTIGRFIVDFLCVEAGLVVELDGGQHDEECDRRRTDFLETQGLCVRRFWNDEVLNNMEGVFAVIRDDLAQRRKTLTQPSPAKAGEG